MKNALKILLLTVMLFPKNNSYSQMWLKTTNENRLWNKKIFSFYGPPGSVKSSIAASCYSVSL